MENLHLRKALRKKFKMVTKDDAFNEQSELNLNYVFWLECEIFKYREVLEKIDDDYEINAVICCDKKENQDRYYHGDDDRYYVICQECGSVKEVRNKV